MSKRIAVAYDISLLGAGHISQQCRTGIFRAIEETLLNLIHRKQLLIQPMALNGEATIWDDISSQLYCKHEQPDLLRSYRQTYHSPVGLDNLYTASVKCQKSLISVSKSRKSICYRAGRLLQLMGSKVAQNDMTITQTAIQSDVYHGAYFPLPKADTLSNIPRVFTIYDLIPVLFPQFVVPKVQRRTVEMLNSIDMHKDWVICISEHTKTDFCQYSGMSPDRVFVVPLAASDDFYSVHDSHCNREIIKQYGISDSPYILSLCTLEPRKNLDFLINGFADYVAENPSVELNLVLVGISGWKNSRILQATQNNPQIAKRVIFTGYVPDEHLAHIYSSALAFAYPSLYEGFGLPPLEAMQCGTPVIASNVSSLPEVVGDAGILIDPRKKAEMSDAISRIVNNPTLRESLSQAALKRAQQFSWSKVADDTVKVYETAIAHHS